MQISLRSAVFALGVAAAAAGAFLVAGRATGAQVAVPPPALDPQGSGPVETAVLAGGCFWGVQAVFEHVNGVTRVLAGYSGGELPNPTYEQVSTERTGHAEAVQITFDPSKVSFGTLLRVFFSVAHDPTQLNRQGPDVGPSYRSHIFYGSDTQKRVAEAYIAQLSAAGSFSNRIVTRVDSLKAFYRAEEYHQDFLIKHPTHPYIVINDLPKLADFKRLLPSLYRAEPASLAERQREAKG